MLYLYTQPLKKENKKLTQDLCEALIANKANKKLLDEAEILIKDKPDIYNKYCEKKEIIEKKQIESINSIGIKMSAIQIASKEKTTLPVSKK